MKLKDVHPGTVVRLKTGQAVVTAIGPGRGRRYVMQSTGVMLDTSAKQEVEIISTAWSSALAPVLIGYAHHL